MPHAKTLPRRKRRQRHPLEKLNLADLELISRLALDGQSAEKIAARINDGRPPELRVCNRTISKRLTQIDADYLARMTESTVLRIAKHHAQVDHLIELAIESFRRSQRAEPMKVIHDDGSPPTFEDGPGDPRFLAVVATFMDRRARLLGTDKAPDAPAVFIGNPLRLGAEMTIEQAAEITAMTSAQLLDLSARCRADLESAKAKILREARGDADGEPN